MILVFVEHFLNEKGQNYFPEWIKEVKEVLNNFDGYIDLEQLRDIQNEKRSLLQLRFDNIALLKKWAASEVHDQMIKKLSVVDLTKTKISL